MLSGMYKQPNYFVKHLTNLKLPYLLAPRVIDFTSVIYPWHSFVIYDHDETNLVPSSKLPIFNNVDKSIIFNFIGLDDESVIYGDECKALTSNKKSIIKKYMKSGSTDYLIHIDGRKDKWTKKDFEHNPLILSYNLYTEANKCKEIAKEVMKKEIDKFYSKLSLIKKINKRSKYFNKRDEKTLQDVVKLTEDYTSNKPGLFFINLSLPNRLLPFTTYKQYLKKELDNGILKFMYKQENMNPFFLFLILDNVGTGNKYDILNYMSLKDIAVTHLLFEHNGKVTFTSLYFVLSLIKELDIPAYLGGSYSTYKRDVVIKLLYKHLEAFYELSPMTISEIENNLNVDTMANISNNSLLMKLTTDEKIDINEKDINSAVKDLEVEKEDNIIDVDSEVLEEDVEENITTTLDPNKTDFNMLEDIDKLVDHIDKIENKDLKKKAKKVKEELSNLKTKKVKIGNEEVKIEELLKVTPEDIDLKKNMVVIPNVPEIDDKDYYMDTVTAYDKVYIEKIYKKDIIRSIVGTSNMGFVPKNIEIEEESDVLGKIEHITVDYVDMNGKTHKVKFKLSAINKEGTYKMSGNSYRLRKQRADKPYKKLAWNAIMLTSACGKVFVKKAPLTKYDAGKEIKKLLLKKIDKGEIRNLISGFTLIPKIKLPKEYSMLGRTTKSFYLNKDNDELFITLDYENRKEIFYNLGYTEKDLNKLEKNYIFIGYNKRKEPLFIDKDNLVYKYSKGKYAKIDTLFGLLDIDVNDIKVEYPMVNLNNASLYVPVVMLLIFYLGLNNLMKTLDIRYSIDDKMNKDADYSMRFSDKVLNVWFKNELQKTIIHGLDMYKKQFRKISIDVLKDKQLMLSFFSDEGLKLHEITKIKAMGPLFVDPVTGNILESMGLPTTFTGLLIQASKDLLTDEYQHPSAMSGYLLRGYDRIPVLIYKQLTTAIKKKMNEDNFSSGRIVVNPFEVWNTMNEDSAAVLEDDLNPVAFNKQKDDTTYLGDGGRKKESMSKDTRVFHPEDAGVISEAVKESGDVGITAYLSASPILKTIRGDKDDSRNKDKKFINLLSSTAMLFPFLTTDDSRRAVFTQIQASHVVPIAGATVNPVRTGYDAIFPYKLPRKFVGYVEEDGKVIKIDDKNLIVKYKTGKEDKFPLADWYSKEESSASFRYTMEANVKLNDKVKKGDIVTYCKQWFEPDMFDKRRVVYKQGIIVKTALQEILETYEDSCSVSSRLSDKLKISTVKTRSIILKKDNVIAKPLKVGDEVNPNDVLLTILGELAGIDQDDFTPDELEVLQNFIRETPKAKYKGKITKIQVFYNCEKNTLNKSLLRLANLSEKEMIDNVTGEKHTGKVDSSYSINGIPLETDNVEIKYFIETEDRPSTGDKFVLGNQLKTTVGEVFEYPIVTDEGDKVDILFSAKSIYARIVNSYMYIGTTTTLLKKGSKLACDIYFNRT